MAKTKKTSSINEQDEDDLLTEEENLEDFPGEELEEGNDDTSEEDDESSEDDDDSEQGDESEDDDDPDEKVKVLLKKKGFKDVGALVDSYESLQKQSTELGKQARLKALTENIRGMAPPQKPQPKEVELEIPEDPQELLVDKDKFKKYVTSVVDTAREAGREAAMSEVNDRDYKIAAQKMVVKIAEDPEKFERLRPIMYRISLNQPDVGFDDLWNQAAVSDTKERKIRAQEMAKEMFGEDIDPAAVKTLLSKARPRKISSSAGDTTGGGIKTKSSKLRAYEDKLKKSILAAGTLNA